MKIWVRAVLVILLLLIAAASLTWLFTQVGVVEKQEHNAYFAAEGIAWACSLTAAFFARKLPKRALMAVLIGGALLLAGTGLTNRPISSTDSARYNWDGIVQKAGIDPYAHIPASNALSELRPAWLFQERVRGEKCPKFMLGAEKPGHFSALCTAINRPLVPTIYPPVAEGLFTLARLPFSSTIAYLPTQLLGLLASLGTSTLLVIELRRRKQNYAWAALWAWSPFVVTEVINASHVDGSATALALAASMLVVRDKRVWGGIVLGLAIATKFLPALVAPPLVRRKPWAIILAAASVVIASYIPHLIAAGGAVLGYLPGYLNEEGYDNGSRSAVLSLLLPGQLATIAAALILFVIVIFAMRRADVHDPWTSQVLIIGSALILTSPKYGWYALLLIPFIILAKRIEWLPLVALLAANQYSREVRDGIAWLLLAQVVLVIAAGVWRSRQARQAESDRLWKLLPQSAP